MNEKIFDFLVCLTAVALIGWGCYEIYKPLCKVSVGLSLFVLVRMARSAK